MGSLSEILFHEILDPRWLNIIFRFSTEIWAEQLKNHPVEISSVESCINKDIRKTQFKQNLIHHIGSDSTLRRRR